MSAILAPTARTVARVVAATEAPVGTFTVRRALPDRQQHAIGPWVFLDHFGPFRVKPGHDGVGSHPHAGIETVTYLLSGRQRHRDSAGHEGIVGALGAQWMTAGRGIVHAETPVPQTDEQHTLHGIQLWTTLPRLKKLVPPRYQNLGAEAIAQVRRPGARIRVVGGEFAGVAGPGEVLMPLLLAHLTLEAGASIDEAVPADFELGAYVIVGEADIGGTHAGIGQLAFLEPAGGRLTVANPGTGPLELMLLGGAPAEGPLVFHGPFVMNTVEQVRAAEVAYRTGRMGRLEE
jgi:redox-sensitive bicupin YhaK (pirin superfamily)